MKLKKKNCVVLIKQFKDNTYSVIGVFKNWKQANKYLAWLEPSNKTDYYISHTSFYTYEKKVEEV